MLIPSPKVLGFISELEPRLCVCPGDPGISREDFFCFGFVLLSVCDSQYSGDILCFAMDDVHLQCVHTKTASAGSGLVELQLS